MFQKLNKTTIMLVLLVVLIQIEYAKLDIPLTLNGISALPTLSPYYAHLSIRNKKWEKFYCGGSLITVEWVLTAAHCTQLAIKITVGLGTLNIVTHKFVNKARRFISHKGYNPKTLRNDIGLVQLSKRAPKSAWITTVPLPTKEIDSSTVPGAIGTAYGFGKYKENSGKTSTVLRGLRVRIIDNQKCYDTFGPKYVTDLILCADGVDKKQNICDGDSGGGLIMHVKNKSYLVGVISFGRRVKCVGAPAGYTKVSRYLDWINSIIA